MTRVSVITTAHRHDDARILEREAVSLAAAGFAVRLTAPGAPSTEVDGVVVGGPAQPSSRWHRMTITLWRAARQGCAAADVVHVHDPELLLALLIMSFRRVRPALVYDVHEDYGAQISQKPWVPTPMRRPLSALFRRFELFVSSRCDLIVAATPHIASLFPNCTVAIVQNMPRTDLLPDPSPPLDRTRFVMMHVGEMNDRRGGAAVVSAAAELAHEPIDFVQIGPVKPQTLRTELACDVTVIDRLAHAELLCRLAGADAGLLLFHHGPNHENSQPNKLFEYLALGLPVIASDIEHWRILAAQCDPLIEFVDPTDVNGLVRAVRRLIDESGDHDRVAQAERARNVFSWEREASVLTRAYSQLDRACATA